MNKAVKGALVGAAGIALLGGGFGTFATWTDSAEADLGTVQTGTLDITEFGEPTWDDLATPDVTGDWSTADRMVPGDRVQMTVPLKIRAEGKNLRVGLGVTGLPPQNITLGEDGFLITVDYAGKKYSVTPANLGTLPLEFTSGDFSKMANGTATVTFQLSKAATDNRDKTIDLSEVSVQVEQLVDQAS
jgi:alternate signal-mediated exported protein